MIKVSTTGMVVSLKTDLRFPSPDSGDMETGLFINYCEKIFRKLFISKIPNRDYIGWYGPEDGYLDYCYKLDDGSWAYSQFVYTETGTFYFDANGYMVRGWQKIDYSWYYFDANGYMLKDWQEIGGKWYYFDQNSGWMYSNAYYFVNNTKYAFAPSGQLIEGWTWDVYTDYDGDVTGDWFYANPNGTAYEDGWLAYNGDWYYISDDGHMLADTINACLSQDAFKDENGNTNWTEYYKAYDASPSYVFDANGVMVTGWYHDIQTTGGQITYDEWYYSDSDGKGHDGWLLYNGAWYYFRKG